MLSQRFPKIPLKIYTPENPAILQILIQTDSLRIILALPLIFFLLRAILRQTLTKGETLNEHESTRYRLWKTESY